jgi:hypothetical protein
MHPLQSQAIAIAYAGDGRDSSRSYCLPARIFRRWHVIVDKAEAGLYYMLKENARLPEKRTRVMERQETWRLAGRFIPASAVEMTSPRNSSCHMLYGGSWTNPLEFAWIFRTIRRPLSWTTALTLLSSSKASGTASMASSAVKGRTVCLGVRLLYAVEAIHDPFGRVRNLSEAQKIPRLK